MELNVNIDPEQINKLVAEAVLNSAIGEQVKVQVQKTVDNLSRSYDNPIEGVIKNHIAELVRTVLVAEHSAALRAKIKASLESKITDEFTEKVVDAALNSCGKY